ncbi:hypothetical protein SAMN04487970_106113 [Paenibacillus tianmuensis]|uniref:Uncharacterized protein n=1 Tax=Paenibacillus tianmuensis TaxID=624147 RepID=A0A1G4TPP3_9BACL|nr:hypothetical protein [Paenibacillus tianmuensis]SCW83354.1 hypothetical protein SAMN04487970_106113 [Paenibacillus tianmuensis]
MKKKLASAIVATALVCSFSTSVFANDVVIPPPSDKGGVITPMEVDKEWGSKLDDGRSTSVRSFRINDNYGHLKLRMVNYSQHSVTVTLEHTNSNFVYFSKTISGGGSLDWKNWDEGFSQGMASGSYVLTWSAGNNDVNGEYWGKAASQTKDF